MAPAGANKPKNYDGSSLRIGIVHARWNGKIIDALLEGTKKALKSAGVKDENIVVQDVPGSWELPIAVKQIYSASQVQSTTTPSGAVASALDLLGASTDNLARSSTPSGSKPASTAPFDAVIAIGVLVKGETMHFEYIAESVSHGLMRVQTEGNVPVVFGLLTVLNEEQGLARAGIKEGGHNHGEDWGSAAVELGFKRRAWAKGEWVD